MKTGRRILQTPVRFYPYTGGVEKYVLDLSKELVKRGNDVTVVCANEPESKKEEILGGINVKRVSYIGKIANTNISPYFPFKILREEFDIIHAHFPTPWNLDWSALISLIKRKPLVLTYHNDITNHPTSNILIYVYNNTFLKLALRIAKKIIITQPDYLKYSKFLKPFKEKIAVIPIGVDTANFRYTDRKKTGNEIFFLGVLDKFHRYKGLDYLIGALAKVRTLIPDVKLIVGGKGELAEEYKKLARKLGLENNVKFIGYVGGKDLIKIYNQSQIFVLPSVSHEEGFGIVLLEAMACGTPVICTNIVGVAKDIEMNKAGIVVKPKNEKELSNALIKILKNKTDRKKMGENALELVQLKYSLDKMAESFEKIYEGVLR